MAANNILPPSQNGFRPGYRTNNCSFVLRCAIDRTRADNQPLHVAFMDLSNAFPSTNLPTLWRKLFSLGARGPVIDTLRMLYHRMEYTVVGRDPQRQCSHLFKSLWGILAGDSASTDFFNIFIADHRPPIPPNHVRLNGRPICDMLQADDIILLATAASSLQLLINYTVLVWCARNFLLANALKCMAMLFGTLMRPLPVLNVAHTSIPYVDCAKYVGVSFQSTHKCIFMQHYISQASVALREACATFSVEGYIGSLPVPEALLLYNARLDPHLTSGCEVSPDTDHAALALLEAVQVSFLRRLLGLHSRSPLVVLFTETGVMPLRFRRALLCLRYLQYLLMLDEDQYAFSAFQDSKSLWISCAPTGSWLGDVDNMLAALPCPSSHAPLRLTIAHTQHPVNVHSLTAEIKRRCSLYLHECLLQSPVLYLLQGRTLSSARRMRAQPYLLCVHIPAHRKALTRLLTACHRLASQSMKAFGVPREQRVCRLCKNGDVEDETHCLFYCMGSSAFLAWRADFYARTSHSVDLKNMLGRISDARAMHLFLDSADDVCLRALARLTHRILSVFDRISNPQKSRT